MAVELDELDDELGCCMESCWCWPVMALIAMSFFL